MNGVRHGFYYLGCCWMLMTLLFVGLMNLLWIAALALLVLIEKTLPFGGCMSRVTGAALAAWEAVILIGLVPPVLVVATSSCIMALLW